MKSSMKQWRRLMLLGIMAWVLLFFALLSYFLDARPDETLTSASSLLSQHPDTRRLTSIQSSHPQHNIVGSRHELASTLTTSYPGDEPEPSNSPDFSQESRERISETAEYPNHVSAPRNHGGEEEEEDDERENTNKEQGNRMRTTRRRVSSDSSDRGQYYFTKPASVLQRLWRGRMSADMLNPRLQHAMKEYVRSNKHRVSYKGHRKAAQSAKELVCQMKAQAQLRTVDGLEEPFASLGWARLVPSLPLDQLYRRQDKSSFKTCAVVTSAGAILHSGLGKEIDSHDAVLRFNSAPTEGYDRDVGNKTTIRIINSQILVNPRYRFNTNSIYRNVTLVAWDPPPYSLNLHKWYASPDFNLFSPYVEYRKRNSGQPFYILHPSYLWKLWDVIQGNTQENIQPNPPSSGFIGILMMMALCEQVHVYEYIPSLRQTDLCHYHERYVDIACTLGAYHPLLFEKRLIQRINTGPESDLKMKGRVTLPGFSTVNCDK
ncbi:beta-galactoside alpha-2%2C6-sialyltransferase 2 [Scomber scombrus]|uniref:Beta-galactoside alpha-2,6-sialyltransferase 2 n=1 Tax=Scomber scombrus TaxID=13677 RepID=A0AAV1NJR4_SCOSC